MKFTNLMANAFDDFFAKVPGYFEAFMANKAIFYGVLAGIAAFLILVIVIIAVVSSKKKRKRRAALKKITAENLARQKAAENPLVAEDLTTTNQVVKAQSIVLQPAIKSPTPVKQAVEIKKPAPVQQPIVVQQPAPVQQPIVIRQPASVQQPIVVQQPAQVQQPIIIQVVSPAPAAAVAKPKVAPKPKAAGKNTTSIKTSATPLFGSKPASPKATAGKTVPKVTAAKKPVALDTSAVAATTEPTKAPATKATAPKAPVAKKQPATPKAPAAKKPAAPKNTDEIKNISLTEDDTKSVGKYQITFNKDNDLKPYNFRLVANNGQILFESEPYKVKPATRSFEAFKNAVTEGVFTVDKEKNGTFRSKLYNKSNALVGVGESFKAKSTCESNIDSIRTFAFSATVIEDLTTK